MYMGQKYYHNLKTTLYVIMCNNVWSCVIKTNYMIMGHDYDYTALE